jgi:spermidine/putrescine ABC transporter ATP-binding subunit
LTALLRIEELEKNFGAVAALRGVDLVVEAGEIFVLLGDSGSGKTTLLRCIGGFEQPDAGRIFLAGENISGVLAHRRPVNTMFQSYALFPHMRVAENIGFGLRQAGLPRAEISARVAELLSLVRLPEYGARWPHQLSGGQSQRVALARALACRPKLLLLDEPLAALDRGLRVETRAELLSLQRALGLTFLLVTHDQEEAISMASRIGVMRDGRLEQVGAPAEVYERPANRFVAEFLGAANILPAIVRERGAQGTLLRLQNLDVRVRVTAPGPLGKPVLLALRPERLFLGDAGPNVLEGTLTATEYRGEALELSVRIADGTILRVRHPLADGIGGALPVVGERVKISFRPDAGIVLQD